jgi:hypothetical protein
MISRGIRRAAVLALAVLVVVTTGAFASVSTRSAAHRVAWGSPFQIDKLEVSAVFTGVSCQSPKFCAAVDASGNAFTFHGVTWRSFRDVDSNAGGLYSISCPSARFCLASDQDGFTIEWNGRHWSPPRQFDFYPDEPSLPTVSCVSARFCAAVDQFGDALVWHGKRWSHKVISTSTGDVDLQAISCVSTSFCMAVGNGFTVSWNGRRWSKPRTANNNNDLMAVSCTSTRFCVAGGYGFLNYNGRHWTTTDVTDVSVDSVSCVSSRDCWAADGSGVLYHWAHGRWTIGKQPVYLNIDLSCKTSSFCAGVTGSGQGLFYAPVPYVTTASLPSGRKGAHYSARLHASGGEGRYHFRALSGLPRGLKVSTDGTMSGRPTVSGHFSIKIAVTDPLRERSTKKVRLSITSAS